MLPLCYIQSSCNSKQQEFFATIVLLPLFASKSGVAVAAWVTVVLHSFSCCHSSYQILIHTYYLRKYFLYTNNKYLEQFARICHFC